MVITKEMGIGEIVAKHPKTVEVFRNYGMGCLGCASARFENIEQGAQAHGIDIEALLVDLNKVA
jgi:hybrid cluster-associated redox disulfide protein